MHADRPPRDRIEAVGPLWSDRGQPSRVTTGVIR